jgi:hypothetical protein
MAYRGGQMLTKLNPRRSPTLVIAMIALIAALGGSAIAAGGLTGKQKKQVRKISDKEISKKAGGLSVANAGHAGTADNATNAANAAVAQSPVAWAHVSKGGTLLGSSSNISQANVVEPYGDGEYCFKGLGFAFKSALANVDFKDVTSSDNAASVGIPDPLDCEVGTGGAGTQAGVVITNASFDKAAFYIWFFN